MRKLILAAAGAGMVVATPAVAGTNSATLNVQAQVAESCEVTDATLSWTGLGVLSGTDHDTSTSMDITCTTGADYFVTMGAGLNASGGSRFMVGGTVGNTDTIGYELYLGDPSSGGVALTAGSAIAVGTGTGASDPMDIWGRIPSTQANVTADNYTDTVAVTISF